MVDNPIEVFRARTASGGTATDTYATENGRQQKLEITDKWISE